MFQIPDAFQKQFDKILIDKHISGLQHPYYRKWVRFYYDFCKKYGHSELNPASLPLFTNKLREKKQNDFQINQAIHAVSLFYEFAAIPDGSEKKALIQPVIWKLKIGRNMVH